jgi:hypothetical protein
MDYTITKSIYNVVNNNKYVNPLPYYLGLVPYEIYVLPGMYIAILQTIWFETINPIQFHLLPHWFAYSLFQLLKKSIKKKRPGCEYKELSKYINSSHCSHGHEMQSFPSGHTGVAFALATALFMEMIYSKNPHFFEYPIVSNTSKYIISMSGFFVAIMISIHRISKGYHSLFDVFIGMMCGVSIGFISWIILEKYKVFSSKYCENKNNLKECNKRQGNKEIIAYKLIITIIVSYLFIKFITKDFFKLSAIKH